MRIVLVIDQYDNLNNGTTATARRYAQALRDRGHQVRILAAGETGTDKITVPEFRIPFFQFLVDKQGFCFAKPVDEAYYQAFRGADIIHFYLPTRFCRRGEELARQMKIPTIAAFHLQPENVTYSIGLGKNRWANEMLYRFFYRYFYQRFQCIHCPSGFIAAQLARHSYDNTCYVISNGVDKRFIPKTTTKPQALQNKFSVLMIGRLSGEKRQDIIIKAAQLTKHRDKIQLVFAGRGPKEKAYRKLAAGLPHPPLFGFYTAPKLHGLICGCDLYVHASDAEIEGIACMEALACGLVPVISDSPLSAAKDFALSPESLFAAGDPQSLADRIDFWIDHPEQRRAMGKAYAEKAEEMRVEHCVAQAEQMYRQAIATYREKGPKPVWEAPLRKKTHPNVQKLAAKQEKSSPLQKEFFSLYTNAAAAILYLLNLLCFGLKIEGRENLRAVKGGAVTVCNHVHPLDCTMVKIAALPRRIYFISLKRNFQLPFVGWLIHALGAIPLPEDMKESAAFHNRLQAKLSDKNFVHFYPEGMKINGHEGLQEFHNGAFLTAAISHRPVIPMVITETTARGLERLLCPKKQMRLTIAAPQYPDAERSPGQAADELSRRTRQLMLEILSAPQKETKSAAALFWRLACLLILTFFLLRFIHI